MRSRPQKVANAIRKEISTIMQTEVKDPRLGFVTITRVEVTPDLRCAKVYYSALGDAKETKSTDIAIKRAHGYVKILVANRLKLRFMPDIIFEKDKNIEYGARVEEILKKIEDEKKYNKEGNGKNNGEGAGI